MRFLKWVFNRFLLLLSLCSASGLLVAYSASFISPQQVWWMFFFALLYPYLLILNIVLFLIYVFGRKQLVWLHLVVILLFFERNLNLIQLHRSPPKAQLENGLKVVSSNVHAFSKYGWRDTRQAQLEFAEFIKHNPPDVLCLQEFGQHQKNYFDVIKFFKDSLMMNYIYHEDEHSDNKIKGLVIVSKYPIVNSGWVVPKKKNHTARMIYADLQLPDTTIRIFNIHLSSNQLKLQEYAFIDQAKERIFQAENDESLSILLKVKDKALDRTVESQKAASAIADSPHPVLLMGDLNEPAYSYAYYQLFPLLQDAFKVKGFGNGITFGGYNNLPPVRIDYIMPDDNFEVLDFTTHNVNLSDHKPISAVLRLRQN